jgi:hypothetical protein
LNSRFIALYESVLSLQSVVNSLSAPNEATIFSKRGSPRSGSHNGITFNLPKQGFGADVTRQTP